MAEGDGTVVLVANARAGALLGGGATLGERLAEAGIAVREIEGEAPLPQRIDQAVSCGARIVLVAGGDGTIACAAEKLAGREAALAILPAGTMNVLATDLGLPTLGQPEVFEALKRGEIRAIDLGEVDGHVFACAAMLGSPSRLGRHREAGREDGALGWLRFARAALRAVRRHRALEITLRWPGGERRLRTPALTISVNALDDLTGHRFGRKRLDGGELAAYALRPRSAYQALRFGVRLFTGRWRRDPALDVVLAPEITVDAPVAALHVMLDGEEHLLETPLHFRVRPKALRVVA